jgi:hypothetical protein
LEAVVVPPPLLQVQDITQVYGSVVQELQLPEKDPDAVGHGGGAQAKPELSTETPT